MSRHIILIVLLSCTSNLLFAQVLHDLQLVLSDNSQANSRLTPKSHMFAGIQMNNLVEMKQLDSEQDGEVFVDLIDYDEVSDLFICLKVDNVKKYCWKITPSIAYVEALGDRMPGTEVSFQIGDEFRVGRCQDKILYYHNNRLVHVMLLADNDDILFGLVESPSASLIKLHVQFIPM